MVCSGRLPGASSFGWPGSSVKPAPRFWKDAEAVRRQPRAEAVKDRVDQRHRHAVAVHHRHIDRVAVDGAGGLARVVHRLLRVDQRGQRRHLACVQHRRKALRHRRGVGDEAVARVKGQFRGLGLEVDAHRAHRVEAADLEMLQQPRHQQRGRAVAVGRHLDDLGAAIGRADRLDVIRRAGGEILRRVQPAQATQAGDHVVGDLALIERARAVLRHPAQHVGLTGGAEHVAHARGGAV